MAASRQDIEGWLKRAKKMDATHMIVVCDTYDHEDYPVYVGYDEDVRELETEFNNKDMQRVMEIYNLSKSIKSQMNEHRAFNY